MLTDGPCQNSPATHRRATGADTNGAKRGGGQGRGQGTQGERRPSSVHLWTRLSVISPACSLNPSLTPSSPSAPPRPDAYPPATLYHDLRPSGPCLFACFYLLPLLFLVSSPTRASSLLLPLPLPPARVQLGWTFKPPYNRQQQQRQEQHRFLLFVSAKKCNKQVASPFNLFPSRSLISFIPFLKYIFFY